MPTQRYYSLRRKLFFENFKPKSHKEVHKEYHEDYYRMIWSVSRAGYPIFIILTIGLFISNYIYYKNKWSKYQTDGADSEGGKEILPKFFSPKHTNSIVFNLILLTIISSLGLISIACNYYQLSHLTFLLLMSLWFIDYYQVHHLVIKCTSIMLIAGHISHLISCTFLFLFTFTLFNDNYKGSRKTPKEEERTRSVIMKRKPKIILNRY